LSSKQNGSDQANENVQELSKRRRAPQGLGKADVRYWQQVVFFPTYTRGGVTHRVPHLAVKLQHGGRRETIPLGTSNKAAAATKAKDFYLTLKAAGWDAALAKFQINGRRPGGIVTTVGEFIAEAKATWSGDQKTLADYARAFRKMVADIFQIEGGKRKYDHRTGGRDEWINRIDSTKLRDVTPDRLQKWKVAFLNRAGTDPMRKRRAAISVNSLLRQAKSLFAPAVLKFVKVDGGSPFTDIRFEPRQSMRYQSSFDIEALIKAAQAELSQEQFKIFLLAAMAGLRRNEIDKLEWAAFDWQRGLICIRTTAVFSPKSEDSTGDVEVDAEVMELFQGYRARSTSSFVVASPVAARPGASYSNYRCEKTFAALAKWLRAHGVKAARPLHTLRKEFGSQVCAHHGIYAASRALRHADIGITGQHYLDKRQRTPAGLGKFLASPVEHSSYGTICRS
jgi:integrase